MPQLYNMMDLERYKYEFALQRIEELLPLVDESTPAIHPDAIELSIVSDYVIAYEKKHYPVGKPTIGELIQLSLEEKGMSQKQLAEQIGVSPARVSDYVHGRAEPTLRVARLLCAALGIAPALMLGM